MSRSYEKAKKIYAMKERDRQEEKSKMESGRGTNGAGVASPIHGNFIERKAPILFKFQKPGDTVQGRIQAIEKIEITDKRTGELKPAVQYVIFDELKNQSYQILGTYDIKSKLRRQDVGKKVVIRFDHVSAEITKDGQGMFVFRVGVDESSAEGRKLQDGTQITDADIPF